MFSNFKVSNEAKIENYIKRLISLLTGKEVLINYALNHPNFKFIGH